MSFAGLVPVMALAERAGLSGLVSAKVSISGTAVASAGMNPAAKLSSIIAGMAAGADSIDDLDVIRSGGMPRVFAGVYACASLGQFLRSFTHGHALQLASVARAHLVNLVAHTGLLPGLDEQAYVDIDSLLRPVYGHAKQGGSYGHAKIAGRQVLRKGLSPLATTICTATGAPVIAGIRLRAGKAGSGKGAASMVREAIGTARACEVPKAEVVGEWQPTGGLLGRFGIDSVADMFDGSAVSAGAVDVPVRRRVERTDIGVSVPTVRGDDVLA